MVFGGIFFEIGKATDTIIKLIRQHLSALADISFALIALDLVGWVDDILSNSLFT